MHFNLVFINIYSNTFQVDTVDGFNNRRIHPLLHSLLAKDYFRYFQYQPSRPCPFWDPVAEGGKCTSSYCAVQNCPATDLPPGISGQVAEQGHTQVRTLYEVTNCTVVPRTDNF
jgi:hypothetical protein